MTVAQLLREEADMAYAQLQQSLDGIGEGLAWAQLSLQEGDYLNTNGTIIGIVQHIGVCKLIYASAAFRGLELRFRDCIERQESVGTSWAGTLAFLEESHQYWLQSWPDLDTETLSNEHLVFRGTTKPAWKIIATVTQHDAYHAGQIELMRGALAPASMPPDMRYEEERTYVVDLPTW